jgi:nitrite reductase/ring-hydroxylating ferredoxin subunit
VTVPGSHAGEWTRIASFAELTARGRLKVGVDGDDILLVRAPDGVYACGNVCAHQHFSMLHAGSVRGHDVTCPMHGWTYDVRTGLCRGGEGRIPVYAVMVRGDDILLQK